MASEEESESCSVAMRKCRRQSICELNFAFQKRVKCKHKMSESENMARSKSKPSHENGLSTTRRNSRQEIRLVHLLLLLLLLLVTAASYCTLIGRVGAEANESSDKRAASEAKSLELESQLQSEETLERMIDIAPAAASKSRRHTQAALKALSRPAPLAFAMEPPALVEYSNTSGAVVHCRPSVASATSGPLGARSASSVARRSQNNANQAASEQVTISWRRLIKMDAQQLDEVELKRLAASNEPWPARRRFVRQDGALVLPPVAPSDFKRELHSAKYRCCLLDAAGHSLCSRQVQTRAVFHAPPPTLSVFDELASAGQLAIFKCQVLGGGGGGDGARAQSTGQQLQQEQLEFTGWLKDDKLLGAWDETKLARQLARQQPEVDTSLPKYLTTRRGELVIRNVSAWTQDQLGSYKCRARNKLTGEQLTSQVGAKLLLLDSERAEPRSEPSRSESLEETAQVIVARELDNVLLCAKFILSPAHNFRPTSGANSAPGQPKFAWFKLGEGGQKVPLAGSDSLQESGPLAAGFRQLDSCLSIASATPLKHSGEYSCELKWPVEPTRSEPVQVRATQQQQPASSRQAFKLLVLPQKLDVQLKSSQQQAPATAQAIQVQLGAALQLECSLKSALPVQLSELVQLSVVWFRDSRMLFNRPLEGLQTAGRRTAVGQQSFMSASSSTSRANVKLMQPNVIAIESFDLNDRGYYQCLVYASGMSLSTWTAHADGEHEDQKHELAEPSHGQQKRARADAFARLKLASAAAGSLADNDEAELKQKLESSEQFRNELELFEKALDRLGPQLSGSGQLQVELVTSKPQLVQRFAAPSEPVKVGGQLTLECLAIGLPVPRIAWFLDGFLLSAPSASADELATSDQVGSFSDQNLVLDPSELAAARTSQLGIINQPEKFRISTKLLAANQLLSQLNVSQLDEMDAGQYKCQAANGHGPPAEHSTVIPIGQAVAVAATGSSTNDFESFFAPFTGGLASSKRPSGSGPKLRTYQPRNVSLHGGQNGTLFCPLIAGQRPGSGQVIWFHRSKEQRLPLSHRQRITSSGLLEISNVDVQQDAGLYACRMEPASDLEGQLQVGVQVAPLIDSQSLPEVVQANEGMRTKLVCSILQGDHPIDVKWLRRVNAAAGESHNKTPAFKLLDGRKLAGYELMSNVQQSRQSLIQLDDETETQQDNLGQLEADSITIHNLDDSCLLTFKKIAHRDAGDYLCLAQNQLSTSLRQVRVIVNVAPSWSIEPPGDIYVQLSQRLQIDCLAHGQPVPSVTWRRSAATLDHNKASTADQQQLIELEASNRIYLLANGSLLIEQVELSDAGVLMCEQTNGVGSGLSKLVRLHVQVAPYFLTAARPTGASRPLGSKQKPTTVTTGQLAGQAELSCQAFGDQPMIVGWRKGPNEAVDLVYDERRKVAARVIQATSPLASNPAASSSLESTLTIVNLTRADTGGYSCVASNEFGTEEQPLVLIVQEAPEEPELMRPIRAEARQATLTFRRPFDGNSLVRKYAIIYKQLAPAGAASSESPRGDLIRGHSNETAASQDDEWKQTVVEAPGGSDSELVNLNLCCLKPFTRYAVRLRAINDLGQSPLTRAPVRFQTEEEAVGGPPQEVSVEPTGAHSLKVRWREPARHLQNSLIRGYYIGYRAFTQLTGPAPPLGSHQINQMNDLNEQYQYKNVQLDLLLPQQTMTSDLIEWDFANQSRQTAIVDASDKPQVYSTYLTNLRRKTTYSVIVQAYNKIGAGPRSDQTIVSTLDAAPPMSPVLKHQSSSQNAAQFVWWARRFVSARGSTLPTPAAAMSLLHSQEMLDEDDDPQAFYTINFKLDERYTTTTTTTGSSELGPSPSSLQQQLANEWQQKRVTRTPRPDQLPVQQQPQQQQRSFTLTNLRCGSAYLAFMTATNSLGQSEPGETIKFQTRGGAPVPPTQASDFLRVNSTFVVLRLSQWHDAGCLINSFLIKYRLHTQLKWTILEHQVQPTIQTITIAGSSVFSTRAHSPADNKSAASMMASVGPSLDAGARALSPDGSADISPATSSKQANLNDFVLRSLDPEAGYKLLVEANSEAGSTAAEFDFETGNFTASLLSVHVNGLVARRTDDGEPSVGLAALGKRSEMARDLEFYPTGTSGGQLKYGTNSNGLWLQSRQNLGVWSLTVLFVGASILMAVATLILGFKSLVRIKQHGRATGGRLAASSTGADSSEGLVSTLLCCSSSSASSSGSNSGSSAASNCYQLPNHHNSNSKSNNSHSHYNTTMSQHEHHEHSFQDASSTPYCTLPLHASLAEAGSHYGDAHLTLAANSNPSANLYDGPPTISGLLMRSPCLHDDHRAAAQMVSSASLSAIVAANQQQQPRSFFARTSRDTMTLAPQGSRRSILTNGQQLSGDHLLQQRGSATHHASTLGRQPAPPLSQRMLNTSQELQLDEQQQAHRLSNLSPSFAACQQATCYSTLQHHQHHQQQQQQQQQQLDSAMPSELYRQQTMGDCADIQRQQQQYGFQPDHFGYNDGAQLPTLGNNKFQGQEPTMPLDGATDEQQFRAQQQADSAYGMLFGP